MNEFDRNDIIDALKSDEDVRLMYQYGNENTEPIVTNCRGMDFDYIRPTTVTRRPRGIQGAGVLSQYQEIETVEHQAVSVEYEEAVPAEYEEVDPAEYEEAVPAEHQEVVPAEYQEAVPVIEQYQQRPCPPLYSNYGNSVVDGLMPQPLFVGYNDPWVKERDKRITDTNRAIVARYNSEKAVTGVLEELDLNAELNDMRQRMSCKLIEPLPTELSVNVNMPFDSLPNSMLKVVREVSDHLEVGEDATLLALLGVIFVSCRGNFIIKVKKGYWEALTEYLMIVMPSGSRKSAIIGFFRKFVEDVEKELQQAYRENAFDNKVKCELLKKIKSKKEAELSKKVGKLGVVNFDGDAAELVAELKQIDLEIQRSSTYPRFLVDKPTLKALAIAVQEQGEAIAVCEAEGGLLKDRLKKSNDDIILKGFTMEPYGEETSTGKRVFIKKTCVTLCLYVQSSVAEKIYSNETLKDDGLIPRILPAFLPRISSYNRVSVDISEDVIELCSRKIKSLLMMARPEGEIDERTYHTIKLSTEAQRIHREYVQQNRACLLLGSYHGFEPFVEKLAGHAVRLAGAIHVWEHDVPQDHEVNEQAMQGGIDLAEYFLQHVSAAYNENRVKGLKFAKKILRWMNTHRKPKFTERDAHRGVGHCTIVDIRVGLEVLEQHNYIGRIVDVKTTHCVVNPRYSFDHNQL